MASTICRRGYATTLDSSATLLEAKDRAMSFFKECCRALPQIMDIYILHETVSLSDLRSKVASQFRKHENVKSPKIIDMLVFKGKEELQNVLTQSKQRHHILSQYVVGPEGMVQPSKLGIVDHGESDFLKKFYMSNSA